MKLFPTATAGHFWRFRSVLVLALFILIGLASSAHAWTLEDVAQLARQRAQTPYQEAPALPHELAALSYDELRDIRFKEDKSMWRTDKLPFEVRFFPVGRQFDSVRLHEVSASGSKLLPYDASDFNFGKNRLHPSSWGDVGYAGFRVYTALNSPNRMDELIVFQGASYFRALGAGQRYGLSARGLAVNTTGAQKEEFPRFTDFWLVKPAPGASELTIFALLDSPHMTGAYRFDIRPGEQTVTQVHARIFMRAGVKTPLETLGLAPLTSMFLFGANQPKASDYRPQVHDSDGLMMASSDGEWLWRPLQNPSTPLVTSFAMKGLKGFGLMQRERAFSRYEDTEARYDLRPSAWVTPIGDWGSGRVELLLLPAPDETYDNAVAYWVPDHLPQPGTSLDFAYQIAWQGKQEQHPPNGWVTQTRRGTGFTKLSAQALQQTVQYIVDLAGPAQDELPDDAPVHAVVSSDANGRVLESRVWRNPATGGWRLALRVQRVNPDQPIELRAFLQNNHDTVSETWTYIVTP